MRCDQSLIVPEAPDTSKILMLTYTPHQARSIPTYKQWRCELRAEHEGDHRAKGYEWSGPGTPGHAAAREARGER